jgi:hypothetical protein
VSVKDPRARLDDDPTHGSSYNTRQHRSTEKPGRR